MILLVAFSAVGVLAALARGGSAEAWSGVRVHAWQLAFASLALQLVLHNPPVDSQPWAVWIGPASWTLCLMALAGVLFTNARRDRVGRPGWAIAAAGVTLNVIVVAANGGVMPQSVDARRAVHGVDLDIAADANRLRNVVSMSTATHLNALGDVIAEPAWLPKANVISIGDLLLGLGLALWAYRTTRTAGPARPCALTG